MYTNSKPMETYFSNVSLSSPISAFQTMTPIKKKSQAFQKGGQSSSLRKWMREIQNYTLQQKRIVFQVLKSEKKDFQHERNRKIPTQLQNRIDALNRNVSKFEELCKQTGIRRRKFSRNAMKLRNQAQLLLKQAAELNSIAVQLQQQCSLLQKRENELFDYGMTLECQIDSIKQGVRSHNLI